MMIGIASKMTIMGTITAAAMGPAQVPGEMKALKLMQNPGTFNHFYLSLQSKSVTG